MNQLPSFSRWATAALLALSLAAAQAHVVIEPAAAAAGSQVSLALRVGHGCDNSPTTGLTVQIPAGFRAAAPAARAGWKIVTTRGKSGAADDVAEVSWSAVDKGSYIASDKPEQFSLAGVLPEKTGPLWFKIVQTCEKGSKTWSEVPAQGTSTEGMKMPAALLDVRTMQDLMAAQNVRVEGAWVRATVPGQTATGGFMRLTAREATRLVGVSTPVAGIAEVHEMKMDGGVMKMRPLEGLDLPAGKTVELSPGGYHVMLQGLKAPLAKDSTVPLTLRFKDAKGVESRVEIRVAVGLAAPGASAQPMAMDGAAMHKH